MGEMKVVLKSGIIINAKYEEDEFYDIYEQYISGVGNIAFSNCNIRCCEIACIKWE